MNKRILIAAGGTGGHLIPAITLAEEIRLKKDWEVLFVISNRPQDKEIIYKEELRFKALPIVPLKSKNILHTAGFLARLFIGTIESLFILFEYRPDVVIGFGGYVSGPVVLLASLFRIRTIVHEQNVFPGAANRLLAGFVDKIAISFLETKDYLKKFNSKIVFSGNPIRKSIRLIDREKADKGDMFCMFVIGGSQGAHILNHLVPHAVGLLQDAERKKLNIIHISGINEKKSVEEFYSNIAVRHIVFSFTDEMDRFYNECDFVISRAGAMTVSELLTLCKPAVLVPYLYAGGHQRLNADIMKQLGGAVIIDERSISVKELHKNILSMMNRGNLDKMKNGLKTYKRLDACAVLTSILE